MRFISDLLHMLFSEKLVLPFLITILSKNKTADHNIYAMNEESSSLVIIHTFVW